MWLVLILFALVIYLGVRFISGKQDYWTKMGVKTISSEKSAIMRMIAGDDPLENEIQLYKNLNGEPLAGIVELLSPKLFIADPELIKAILVKDFDSWSDRRLFSSDEFVSKMLFAMNGPEWKAMRKIMTPTFTSSKIRTMFEIFHENNLIFMKHLHKEASKNGQLLDLSKIFAPFTLAVVNSAAFGVKSDTIENPDSYYMKMANKIKTFSVTKIILMSVAPWAIKILKLELLDREGVDFFKGMVKSAIKMRRESGQRRNDFIQLMLDVDIKAESGDKKLTDDDICAQSIQFLFDGFDTVESLMTSACAQMAIYPEMQEKVYQEAKKSADENNGLITYEAIQSKSFDYLDAFLTEDQRLHPIGYMNERVSTVEYKLPGYPITLPKGTIAKFPTYMIQRDAKNYENPEKFDPDRFLPENKGKINSYAYLPFGLGPRACIGMRFALIETKAMIANLVLNFKLEPTAQMEIPVKYSATPGSLKPVSKLILKFTPRKTIA